MIRKVFRRIRINSNLSDKNIFVNEGLKRVSSYSENPQVVSK